MSVPPLPRGPVVIVGAGHAGFQAAASLRKAGFDGPVTLVGDEPGLPYQRPPLSKAYLLGKAGAGDLRFRPERFFAEQAIDLRHDRADRIDRAARTVRLASGDVLGYGHLVLATGARNRPLDVPGAAVAGVHGLRTLADADRLGVALRKTGRAVVIGAGFIGMEFAAVAAARGVHVDVVELGGRVMMRSVSPEISALFEAAHRLSGTRFHLGQRVVAVEGSGGAATGVRTSAGEVIEADLVVFGLGVLPNIALAAEAGLEVGSGIAVGTDLRTSDPAISAIGDCASFPDPRDGSPMRLESVQTAFDQARFVAERIAGAAGCYSAVPWFWTDQGTLKLQIAGLAARCDTLLAAGGATAAPLSVLGFRDGRLAAVESLNAPADHMAARRVLGRPDPGLAMDVAAAAGFDLRAWEAATRRAAAPG